MVDTSNISFVQARQRIAEELNNDEGLYIAYGANIAMYLHDVHSITDYEARNQAAEDIVNILFGDMLNR